MATASPPGQGIKNGMKILVIGRNGVGKSSLINKILGAPRAKVGSSVQPTEHKVVEEIHHTVGENNDIPVTVYDTLGFGDAKIKDRSIIEKAISKMKDADIVLICHRLYARFEDTTEKMLKEMIRALGNDLMQHTIIVFTNGDQYLTEWDESSGITAKEQMEEQEKRHINTVYLAGGGTAGAVLAGAAGGAALGGIIGSPIVPGIGTVAGATVGTVVGGGAGLIVGGVGGTGLTAAGLKVAEKIEKKKENKENN
ncbi:PREDICTED: uncharacterized protein LOC105316212 [Amphimedon queenslandica]|uniref:AIG1-type G domain-containing protein n=1 Tax=Amphimedon queenslandica TaxID=400682 RepID=A0AAN0IU53_AMPQE|nr:PREDICTED: uncharacterized protein LOC105316212 [Amphimedon queenslandica]|eukprot:XP_011409332.1 PREDICTED: uncharacterized protein LOC105316212 [Amphimedon queenslandica]